MCARSSRGLESVEVEQPLQAVQGQVLLLEVASVSIAPEVVCVFDVGHAWQQAGAGTVLALPVDHRHPLPLLGHYQLLL